jgi:hypothetical protein
MKILAGIFPRNGIPARCKVGTETRAARSGEIPGKKLYPLRASKLADWPQLLRIFKIQARGVRLTDIILRSNKDAL